MDKKELRQRFRGLRDQLDPEFAQTSSVNLCHRLMEHEQVVRADALLLYSAVGREVDLSELACWALEQGKTIAYPRCRECEMDFFAITDFAQLSREGSFHIPEPEGEIPFIPDEYTVMLAPGVAFSPEGARLGMGGGYYDRYLSRWPKLFCIGVCHRCQLTDQLPLEPYDRRVDQVICGT